jgi:hypothetical protein
MNVPDLLSKMKRRVKDRVREGRSGSLSATASGAPSNTHPPANSSGAGAISSQSAPHLVDSAATSSVGSLSSTAGPSFPTQTPKQAAWAGLKTFLGILNAAADAFGPLKLAVDELVECIDLFEVSIRTTRMVQCLTAIVV